MLRVAICKIFMAKRQSKRGIIMRTVRYIRKFFIHALLALPTKKPSCTMKTKKNVTVSELVTRGITWTIGHVTVELA